MAKRKSSKLAAGTLVRVKEGVRMPEFSDVDISGWTGTVAEVRGRGPDVKCFVEWDAAALEKMPEGYRQHCQSTGLYYGMACLAGDEVEPLAEA
jgi:hypothetical protein